MRRGVVLGVLSVLVVGVTVIPWLLRSVTDSMLFYPARGQHVTPAQVGLSYEERFVTTEDGVRVQTWWLPAAERGTTTVITFHGNAGTVADRLPWIQTVVEAGVSVLAVEYRGYGDSEGRPSEEGLAADARAGLALARELAAARGDRIVVHGRSLGGAVAIRLASDVAGAAPALDGVIVESTFTALRDMANRSGIPLASHLVAYEFASVDRIVESPVPLLVVHGEADELIPVAMGERLVERARAAGREVTWLSVPGGTHNDTWFVGGRRYWDAVFRFIRGA